MIGTMFNGEDVLLVTEAPNWAQRVETVHEMDMSGESSLSDREARRPHASTLRSQIAYTALLGGAELRVLQTLLAAVQTHVPAVLCPFWPGVRRWLARASAPIGGGVRLVWKADWSQWDLYTTTEPAWPSDGDYWAPVLWGYLGSRDAILGTRWYTGALSDVSIVVSEDGPPEYALQPSSAAPPAGPLPPSGYATAPRLLPLRPNWEGLNEQVMLPVDRRRIGFRRQARPEFYPQKRSRTDRLGFQLGSLSQIATMLAFFRDVAGRGAAWWWPNYTSAIALAAPVAAASAVLSVADPVGVEAGDYLAADTPVGLIGRRATATASGSVTLNAAFGVDLPRQTLVSPLLLVRLDRPRLTLAWTHGDLADCELTVREVPAEYIPGADETVGTSLGVLPERGYLYDVTRDHGGTLLHDRYTSYERDVTYGGHTWVSADIQHGAIERGLALERGRVDLASRVFPGNPLVDLASLRSEAPVRLVILSGDVAPDASVSNVAVIATGEVDKASVRGERISGMMTPGGRLLDQQAPGFVVGPGCNHTLFSAGCGLARSAWVHTAQVNGMPTATYPFLLALDGLARSTGPTPAWFEDWFAHGWVEFGTPGSGGWQRRWILRSTAPSGGALSLTLHKPFDPAPADNTTATLYPGCDLTPESCKAYHGTTNPKGKFDNYTAFGGHPFVPSSNPSLVKLSTNLGGGKK